MNSTAILIYKDRLGMLGFLPDEEAGKIIKALVKYLNDGTTPTLEAGASQAILQNIIDGIDISNEKYEQKQVRNSYNAWLRFHKNDGVTFDEYRTNIYNKGREEITENANASERMQSHPNACNRIRTHANKDKDKKQTDVVLYSRSSNNSVKNAKNHATSRDITATASTDVNTVNGEQPAKPTTTGTVLVEQPAEEQRTTEEQAAVLRKRFTDNTRRFVNDTEPYKTWKDNPITAGAFRDALTKYRQKFNGINPATGLPVFATMDKFSNAFEIRKWMERETALQAAVTRLNAAEEGQNHGTEQ